MKIISLCLLLSINLCFSEDITPKNNNEEIAIQKILWEVEQETNDDTSINNLFNAQRKYGSSNAIKKKLAELIRKKNDSITKDITEDLQKQRELKDSVIGDALYENLSAKANYKEQESLAIIEFYISQEQFKKALSTTNSMIRKFPDSLAALQLKTRLLEKISKLEKKKLEREMKIQKLDYENEFSQKRRFPLEPEPKLRPSLIIFPEDIEELERAKMLEKLQAKIPVFSAEEAPLNDVLKQLFAIAGLNYIIVDSAMTEETLSLELQNESIESILTTVQRMVKVIFNYHGTAVYVTSSESPVLITEVIRLQAGLTDVLSSPSISSSSTTGGASSSSTSSNSTTGSTGSSTGGSGIDPSSLSTGEGTSDLERFLEKLPELANMPEGSSFYLDKKSNSLFVRSSPAAIAEVKRLIKIIDYNNVQVLVEARFVEISDSASKNLGIDWNVIGMNSGANNSAQLFGLSSGNGSVSPMNALPIALATSTAERLAASAPILSQLSGSQPGASVGIMGTGTGVLSNFSLALNAMEDSGDANTLSEPKILTLNNSWGIISLQTEVPYVSNWEDRSTGSTLTTDPTTGVQTSSTGSNLVPIYSTVGDGIILKVRPSVARNSDVVTLEITPTIKEVVQMQSQQFTTNGSNAQVQHPVVAVRQVSTKLHIRDGQTIVLGGLIKEQTTDSENGVPGLSRVPLLGRLFRKNTSVSRRSKLLIFVTAYIIDPVGKKYTDQVEGLRDTAKVILSDEAIEAKNNTIRKRLDELNKNRKPVKKSRVLLREEKGR